MKRALFVAFMAVLALIHPQFLLSSAFWVFGVTVFIVSCFAAGRKSKTARGRSYSYSGNSNDDFFTREQERIMREQAEEQMRLQQLLINQQITQQQFDEQNRIIQQQFDEQMRLFQEEMNRQQQEQFMQQQQEFQRQAEMQQQMDMQNQAMNDMMNNMF